MNALELPHQIRCDLADAANAEQREIAIDLGLEQADAARHAGFAAGDRGIEEGRPIQTKCAPSAKALITSVPRRMPPSTMMVMPFASAAISGSVRRPDIV